MMRNDVRHCSFLFFVIHASLVSTHRYSGIQTETRVDLFLKRWVDLGITAGASESSGVDAARAWLFTIARNRP